MSRSSRFLAARALGLAAALVLPPSGLHAQRGTPRGNAAAGEQSAPIANIRYDVTFDTSTAPRRTFKVAMSFDVQGAGPVLLSLPAWTPGAYEITNFARWVSNFTATAPGKPLTWDKLDFDTWRISPAGARQMTVSFDYRADSLDNAIAWSSHDFALVNGTNIFLYPEGRPLDFPATVRIHTDPTWRIATGMPSASEARSYRATNYHDLVDFPFFIGRFDLDSTRIADRWVRLATWPVGAIAGKARDDLWEQHRRMMPAEIKVFGEAPFQTYTTMIMIDSASGGGSALEHQNSHVGIYSPFVVGNLLLPSITAHEMFHLWNVKRLRPSDMWPYRYDRAMPTPWLWVSEGITDYYADLALVRGGIVDSTGFMQLTQGKIQEVSEAPAVSLEDASLSTWIHPTDGTGYIYYPKGSLAGFLLDIMIRDASDNGKSLDDVMRELYASDYKRGKGFGSDDWWGAVRRAAHGKSFDEFYARYIDGREPFPYATVLPLAGFTLETDTLRVPRLGVTTSADSSGIRVMTVDPTSAAGMAGVEPGDVLLAVGDIPVADMTFGERFRDRYGRSEGQVVPLRVHRDGRDETLSMKIQLVKQVQMLIHADPRATAKAARIRSGILRGETTGG